MFGVILSFMSVVVARPCLPQAGRYERLAYPVGRQQAVSLGQKLLDEFGIDPKSTAIATGRLWRARETAYEAGFREIRSYPQLDDVPLGGSSPPLADIHRGDLPQVLVSAATKLIKEPLQETVWLVDELTILSMCTVLKLGRSGSLLPQYTEVIELPISG